MSKFKVGDKVEVTEINNSMKGKIGVIIDSEYEPFYPYYLEFSEGAKQQYDEQCLKLATPTLEDMPEGTIIDVTEGDEKKVLGIINPELCVLSVTNCFDESDQPYTIEEIKKKGWKIKDQPEPTEEVTMEQVCELFGKDVKIKKED